MRSTAKDLILVFLVLTVVLLHGTKPVAAEPDPIIESCIYNGCNATMTMLAPCGGGATNATLQQNFTYTVTPDLGSCECNSKFYNAFSLCLACIASQAKSLPNIDNQQNWVADCKTYGFNFTADPINYTAPITGGSDRSAGGGGLGVGGIIGITIGALTAVFVIGAFIFLRTRKTRTKGSIFTASGSGGAYEPTPSQPSFNAYSSYHNSDYPDNHGGYTDNDNGNNINNNNNINNTANNDDYYTNNNSYQLPNDPNQQQQQQQQQYYSSSDQNNDTIMMNNLQQHGNYIPPPEPMTAAAVAAVGDSLGSPRPSDSFPQSLRNKNKDWEGRQYGFSSDLVTSDLTLHNDKAVYDEGEDELEPPRARDRFVNDRDDYTARRSLTPPRANMQSYRDEFKRPNFDPEPRRNSGSDRYDSNDDDSKDGAELAARRRRAAELFSAESSRR